MAAARAVRPCMGTRPGVVTDAKTAACVVVTKPAPHACAYLNSVFEQSEKALVQLAFDSDPRMLTRANMSVRQLTSEIVDGTSAANC